VIDITQHCYNNDVVFLCEGEIDRTQQSVEWSRSVDQIAIDQF